MTGARESPARACEHPGCKEPGTCRAPKTRALNSYYWFCAKHAAEYNKSWDYLKGLSSAEIEREIKADETWRAPTWAFGLGIKDIRKVMQDPLGLWDGLVGAAHKKTRRFSKEETAAMKELGLSWPFTKAALSAAYKRSAKSSHPDLNSGSREAEARFKKVAAAHALLKKLFA